jgi:predicted RNase H-like HicB family nuclease
MLMADYIEAAMREARYEVLEDGTWYAEIPELKGVWSDAETREQSRKELEEVLEEWIYLRLSRNLSIPPMGGVVIKAPSTA